MSESELQLEIECFGRLYVASSHVSHAVVRSRSREELLDEVVRVLVEVAKFAMAFIAWEDPETHALVPVARFGDAKGYADRVRMFTDDRPEGQGPGGTAFRAGLPYVCNDFLNDPRTVRWQDAARASGWRASAAFPIPIGGSPHGLLSVYAREAGSFGPDQVELLRQVVLDVAFGLEHLEGEERRREAEAALAVSEERLKMALDAAALGTFDWDLRTGKVVWDGHHERIFGFEPGGFDGTYAGFEKCVHPDDLPKLHRLAEAARAIRGSYSNEFRVIWPDGSERWILGRGEYRFNDSGEACRMCGVVLDITERKRVESALRESEARLLQAVRVAHIGIFDHDHVAGTIYWSPQQRAIYGLGPDERISLESYFELVHPDDRERIVAAVKRAHDPGGDGLFDVDRRVVRRDGSIRWVSTRSQTFFEGEGEARHPVRTVGAARDITEQKQAEEEQKKLATLVAISGDFIGIATLEGRVAYLNRAGMTMVGLESMEEAQEKSILEFFPDSDRERVQSNLQALLRAGGNLCGESRLKHFRTGKPIEVEFTLFPIRDENGVPIYVSTVTRDITERKRAEAEKAKLEEQLFQAQKMESIGRLAGGVAHDFNNLLTVINGYSELVLSKLKPADPLHYSIGQILKAGENAAGLTRRLLAFSRKQILQPRVLDLNVVVEEMRPMLERLVGEDVEVSVLLGAESGTVRGDPHQLEQVILNLAINARDAMAEGGKLRIETANVEVDQSHDPSHAKVRAGRYVLLTVSDSGAGMDAETRQRIFEPFFTTKVAGQGTGLGLSMVEGIVAQSGGTIRVHSEPGMGATFQIYLPALSETGRDASLPATVPALGGSETVLVVEDQKEVRNYAVQVLEAYGYRVIQAESAGEALRYCERERGRIDLVLTDVVMPDLSGVELARQLEKVQPGSKVLLMSGYTDDVIVRQGVVDEAVHFIEKPFSPEELARKVQAVLAGSGGR
jgi:two-component system, cell cycle sensor histidine kinase and response regulator CckA